MSQTIQSENHNGDDIAFEYVLGALDAKQTDAVSRERMTDAELDRRIFAWQAHLQGLADSQTAIEPHVSVRAKLMRRLFSTGKQDATTGLWSSLGLWRGFTAFASLASFVLVFALVGGAGQPVQAPAFEADYCAWFNNEEDRMMWMVWADTDMNQMNAAVLTRQEWGADKSMELWMLPNDGSAPVSLGLMPATGITKMPLKKDVVANAKALAISLEPVGGSPTGAPTGPVLYQAKWWPIG